MKHNPAKLLFLMLLFFFTCKNSIGQSSNPYLGQTLPDSTPLRFGPDYLLSDDTWSWMGSPTFSPDGKEMYFSKYLYNSDQVKMYYTQDVEGVWTSPQIPGFVGNVKTDDPFFFRDNNTLYIKRDVTNNDNFSIYSIQRIGNEWSTAQLVNLPYNNTMGSISNFSISNDSTIYFTLHTALGAFIYKSELISGIYSSFEKLPNQINAYNSSSPFIEKDEKYLLFESDRPGGYGSSDLYVSFKNNINNWGSPINLGNNVNSNSWEYAPKITPDGKYLFFCSKRDGDINSNAYWVDANIIEQLNPHVGMNENNSGTLNISPLKIAPNPSKRTTTLFLELPNTTTISICLFNSSGKKVAEIIKDETYIKGKHEIKLDVTRFETGVYFCVLNIDTIENICYKILILR